MHKMQDKMQDKIREVLIASQAGTRGYVKVRIPIEAEATDKDTAKDTAEAITGSRGKVVEAEEVPMNCMIGQVYSEGRWTEGIEKV